MSQQWSSRLGHILSAAGSAIGLGAIWKFPYVTASNGGSAFLILFLVFSLTLGFILILAETLIGSHTKKDAIGAFKTLFGHHWKWVGLLGVTCSWLIYSYYSVVGGWIVGYTIMAIEGRLSTLTGHEFTTLFKHYITHPVYPTITHIIFAALTCLIAIGGVQKGIEKTMKIMMPLLFIIMIILAVFAITLPGSTPGLKLFLYPDFSKITTITVLNALGLSFFSLSIGLSIHTTYGSYLKNSHNVLRSTLWVIILSCFVCILAGLVIFPALSAAGLSPDSGPGLIFMVMPNFFIAVPAGFIFAILFFFLLLIAALSSAVSLFECIVAAVQARCLWQRRSVCLIVTVSIMLLGTFISLSFGVLSNIRIFNKSVFDSLDFLTQNIMIPVFGLMACVLVGWSKYAMLLLPKNLTAYTKKIIIYSWRFIAPCLIIIVLFSPLITN